MDTNQLMIGNLLFKDNEIIEVDSIYTASDGLHDVNGYYIKNFKPIPLTEEWLFNFGFVKDSDGVESIFSYKDFRYELYKPDEDKDVWLFCDQGEVLIDIQFIHTLQNIWKFLTNEELILKQL